MASKFYVPVDIKHTALLLTDVQDQILQRFDASQQTEYLANIQRLLTVFRKEIQKQEHDAAGPLIVHHILPFDINSNSFVSPYNKLASWVASLKKAGHFGDAFKDPNKPHYAVPESLVPESGWGTGSEIILSKIQAGCFSSSELLQYLRARDIKRVVLCGLTTVGSVLGSARLGADLDFHIVIPRDGVMDDDKEVSDFLLDRVLPKFVDVVEISDIEELFK
ncbi:Isochorismatase hydrolase [Mollisia scopiformis]|uniref:Isochorismatase hydrolase n=1 Tax=Mollisia scopiformis TaxID=149040 RepID=A0A132B250_MOLSC|nr:Isochorismatase hydrolase [Mollisia scopiformis]KUJ06391.1 Isochorismatase hydrolase [Mollisia scopiformis]